MSQQSQPLLTIGMATHTDFHGVYFTIEALKIYHDLQDVELLVVDNAPRSQHGQEVKTFIENNCGPGFNCRYIPFEESQGTTQTRQKVIDEASGKFVLVTDCHVLFHQGSISTLKAFFSQNPETNDLFSGPMWYDGLHDYSTHFDLVWRSEMWGVWGKAWMSEESEHLFSIRRGNDGFVSWHDLMTGERLKRDPTSNKELPRTQFVRHEPVVMNKGFIPIGAKVDDPPFEIPAMGLGSFAVRKESWPGFNPEMRAFGGEEGYIHEKFRQNDAMAVCLPFLRWTHRFGRPDGVPYPLDRYHKVRNYVLGFQELGLDLKPVEEHFVGQGLMTPEQWQGLVSNEPIGEIVSPPSQIAPILPKRDFPRPMPPEGASLDETFEFLKQTPRDLDEHFDTLKELTMRVSENNPEATVCEFTKRRESTIAFLAGRPRALFSFQREMDPLVTMVAPRLAGAHTQFTLSQADPINIDPINPCDILYIDSEHTADRLLQELTIHASSVRRFIILRGTTMNAIAGEVPGSQGLGVAVAKYVEHNPDEGWFVAAHFANQYGITVLSRDERDRPDHRIFPWAPGFGTGTNMKTFLKKRFGIIATPNCVCNTRAIMMDRAGADWCSENKDTIIDWMQEEFQRRSEAHKKDPDNNPPMKVPFIRPAVSLVLSAFIRKARKQEAKLGNIIPVQGYTPTEGYSR
jgi:glycosyltransferase involved in cell wall biosynthesis